MPKWAEARGNKKNYLLKLDYINFADNQGLKIKNKPVNGTIYSHCEAAHFLFKFNFERTAAA